MERRYFNYIPALFVLEITSVLSPMPFKFQLSCAVIWCNVRSALAYANPVLLYTFILLMTSIKLMFPLSFV